MMEHAEEPICLYLFHKLIRSFIFDLFMKHQNFFLYNTVNQTTDDLKIFDISTIDKLSK